jgi:hypothetical protein
MRICFYFIADRDEPGKGYCMHAGMMRIMHKSRAGERFVLHPQADPLHKSKVVSEKDCMTSNLCPCYEPYSLAEIIPRSHAV